MGWRKAFRDFWAEVDREVNQPAPPAPPRLDPPGVVSAGGNAPWGNYQRCQHHNCHKKARNITDNERIMWSDAPDDHHCCGRHRC